MTRCNWSAANEGLAAVYCSVLFADVGKGIRDHFRPPEDRCRIAELAVAVSGRGA